FLWIVRTGIPSCTAGATNPTHRGSDRARCVRPGPAAAEREPARLPRGPDAGASTSAGSCAPKGSPRTRRALRLQVDCRSAAAVHVERHRDVLVRDHPLAVGLAEANGRAPPDIRFFAARPRSAEPVEAVAEGYVVAHDDAQVAN